VPEPVRHRILVVDDERLARRRLRQLIDEAPGWDVVGEAGSGREAIAAIEDLEPDLVLLDIELTDRTGFDVVSAVGATRMPPVIFVTAYDQHALRAFEVHAVDYLLKPLQRERLHAALARQADRMRAAGLAALRQPLNSLVAELEGKSEKAPAAPGDRLARILVRRKDAMRLVPVGEVRWFEADGNYVQLHLDGATHLVRATLKRLERDLDPAHFVRIHRSRIVNLRFLDRFVPWFSGDWKAVLVDGTRLRASRHYVKRIRERTTGAAE
jgi:two-component system LytT family response regulator